MTASGSGIVGQGGDELGRDGSSQPSSSVLMAESTSIEPMSPDRQAALVGSAELGRLLNVNPKTVEGLARRGRIPCVRVGRLNRFDVGAVMAALTKET